MSEAVREIKFFSEADKSMQPAFFAPASGSDPRPLVVALHTWSYSYDNGQKDMFFQECAKRNWHCIFPHFRGPNWGKEACGSDLVVSDLKWRRPLSKPIIRWMKTGCFCLAVPAAVTLHC